MAVEEVCDNNDYIIIHPPTNFGSYIIINFWALARNQILKFVALSIFFITFLNPTTIHRSLPIHKNI